MPAAPRPHVDQGMRVWTPFPLVGMGFDCGDTPLPAQKSREGGGPSPTAQAGAPLDRSRRVLTPQGLPCRFEESFVDPCRLWEGRA